MVELCTHLATERARLETLRLRVRAPQFPTQRFHVVRKARRVEVQLVFERPLPEVRTGVPERPVGLDFGIRTFAMLSDGGSLQRRPGQGVRSAIRRKQRAVSRSRRGSKSRGKKRAALARAHERMAEAGRQELHRHADWIVRTYDFIAVEALKIGNMLRRGPGKRGLNRAIAEQGWREFFDILKCKAESAGIPFVEVPPGRHIAGMLALRNEGSKGAVRADPPVRRVRPRAGPRRERGQKRAVSRPAHLRRSRGSGWDGARRSRGFRSALNSGAEDPPDSARAVRKAAPGSRTVRIRLASCALDFCKFLKSMNRSGHDARLVVGTNSSGGTLGILSSSSIMLVVMGPVLETPVPTSSPR